MLTFSLINKGLHNRGQAFYTLNNEPPALNRLSYFLVLMTGNDGSDKVTVLKRLRGQASPNVQFILKRLFRGCCCN